MFAAFDVKIQKEFDPVLVLTDNLNMPVTRDQFSNIVKTFHAGSMFYLNAELQPTNIKGACQMVTPIVSNHIFFYQIMKNSLYFFCYLFVSDA